MRADGTVGEAHADRVVKLHLGVERRAHEREDVLAAQVGDPQRDTQQVRQLGLAVAAAAGLGSGPGVGLRDGLGVGTRVVAGLGQQLAGHRVHVQRDVLDLADAAVLVHHLMGADDHRAVVPAVRHEELLAGPLDRRVQLPGVGRVDGEGLLAHHVRAGLERCLGLLEVVAGRAAHDHDVGLLGDDVVPVGGGLLEAELVLDLAQQLRVAAIDDDELDLTQVATPDQVRAGAS